MKLISSDLASRLQEFKKQPSIKTTLAILSEDYSLYGKIARYNPARESISDAEELYAIANKNNDPNIFDLAAILFINNSDPLRSLISFSKSVELRMEDLDSDAIIDRISLMLSVSINGQTKTYDFMDKFISDFSSWLFEKKRFEEILSICEYLVSRPIDDTAASSFSKTKSSLKLAKKLYGKVIDSSSELLSPSLQKAIYHKEQKLFEDEFDHQVAKLQADFSKITSGSQLVPNWIDKSMENAISLINSDCLSKSNFKSYYQELVSRYAIALDFTLRTTTILDDEKLFEILTSLRYLITGYKNKEKYKN